jgi:hypothetical protein
MLLSRIPKSSPDRELLRRCLLWLSFAARPLRLAELAEGVILEHTNENVDSDCRLHSPEILLDISQGLLISTLIVTELVSRFLRKTN